MDPFLKVIEQNQCLSYSFRTEFVHVHRSNHGHKFPRTCYLLLESLAVIPIWHEIVPLIVTLEININAQIETYIQLLYARPISLVAWKRASYLHKQILISKSKHTPNCYRKCHYFYFSIRGRYGFSRKEFIVVTMLVSENRSQLNRPGLLKHLGVLKRSHNWSVKPLPELILIYCKHGINISEPRKRVHFCHSTERLCSAGV